MPELRQTGFDEVPGGRVLDPQEPHLACVLLLDTSSSMLGNPINSLNKAINDFIENSTMHESVQKGLDVAIIEFNDHARVVQDFTPFKQMKSVSFTAVGDSAMGEGINLAIDIIKERGRFYDSLGIRSYKPWIIMISMGKPTDDISVARQRIIDEENKGHHGKLSFWAFGVAGYSSQTLTLITKRCFALNRVKIDEMFLWLGPSALVGINPSISVGDPPTILNLPADIDVFPDEW